MHLTIDSATMRPLIYFYVIHGNISLHPKGEAHNIPHMTTHTSSDPKILVHELSDSNAKDFIAKHKVCVVDVFASWCGTCRLFYPAFEQSASENTDLTFCKIDGEKNPSFSFLVSPESIPYVAVFVDGQLVGGKVCGKKEILNEMIDTIRKNMGSAEKQS